MNTLEFFKSLRIFLGDHISGPGAEIYVSGILLAGIALCAVAGYFLTRLLLRIVSRFVRKTPTEWDDDLLTDRFLRILSQLAPALIVAWLLPQCFTRDDHTVRWLDVLTSFYIIWTTVYILCTLVGNLHGAFSRRERLKSLAVKGIFQMVKLIIIALGAIISLSLLIGKTPVAIITALGASAAVLMLVFRDTILGLVASVQLSANKMLRKGDWVIVPRHDANGEVTDISLTTVKIRNWDNSVTTVPPYSLVSESFQNFQPMRRSGGRRVCRSIYIDFNSIRRLSPEEIESLRREGLVKDKDEDNLADVNLTLFRRYLENWLSRRPEVNGRLLLMVRQLEPTTQGLPLQLYFFTHTTDWKKYEHVQADIFDYVYATVPRFSLAIFQAPSGRDIMTRDNTPGRLP